MSVRRWIRAHFAQPVTVDEMAASVNMSASSFHERFKAVTSMSPLQYQRCSGSTKRAG
jgi:AraC-like DNA-binding protein